MTASSAGTSMCAMRTTSSVQRLKSQKVAKKSASQRCSGPSTRKKAAAVARVSPNSAQRHAVSQSLKLTKPACRSPAAAR